MDGSMSNSTWSGIFYVTDLDAAVRKPRTSSPPLNIDDEVMGGNKAGTVSLLLFFFIHFLPFYVCFSLFLSASSILDDLMKTKDVHENKSKMSRSHSGFLKNCFRRDSSESLGLFCLFVYWCNISIRILLDSHEGWPEIVFKKL